MDFLICSPTGQIISFELGDDKNIRNGLSEEAKMIATFANVFSKGGQKDDVDDGMIEFCVGRKTVLFSSQCVKERKHRLCFYVALIADSNDAQNHHLDMKLVSL